MFIGDYCPKSLTNETKGDHRSASSNCRRSIEGGFLAINITRGAAYCYFDVFHGVDQDFFFNRCFVAHLVCGNDCERIFARIHRYLADEEIVYNRCFNAIDDDL
ncbi:MAG: hypothetical protein BWY72_02514 [Bacteroidetes bacterium ADurb.Bin416]|nr:MAG: hypothetical protein BWY72_02514 [Bacteroidetes bacterium ADurb.Bin416]